jgi:hypothetical protein
MYKRSAVCCSDVARKELQAEAEGTFSPPCTSSFLRHLVGRMDDRFVADPGVPDMRRPEQVGDPSTAS